MFANVAEKASLDKSFLSCLSFVMEWDSQILALGIAGIFGAGATMTLHTDYTEEVLKENRALIEDKMPRCPFPQVDVLVWTGKDWNRICVKSEGEAKRQAKEIKRAAR